MADYKGRVFEYVRNDEASKIKNDISFLIRELQKSLKEDRYDKLGPGTEQNPIDFNDIDISNIDSFYSRNRDIGIFDGMDFKYKYIDISDWDVSNVTDMRYMFYGCDELKSVGDISGWDVSSVTDMHGMFCECKFFNQDLSSWNVSNVTDMEFMFTFCEKFNQDILKWNVSNVIYHLAMFDYCPIKEEYKPKFK